MAAAAGYLLKFNDFRDYISKEAEGSGFPEVKAMLAGLHLSRFLSINAYIAKVIGITGMFCGGMSVGRTGTNVHLSSVCAN